MDRIREWIRRAKEGDKEAKDKVFLENMGLVWSVTKGFQGRGYDMEDLFQVGSIGLLKSIQGFDLTYPVRFSTYAVPMIAGEIKRFLRDDGMIKVSRKWKEDNYKIYQTMESLIQKLNREPTISEISHASGLTEEEIVLAMEAGINSEVESLDRMMHGDDSRDGKEISVLEKISSKEDVENKVINKVALKQMLEELSEREQLLVQMRYFKEKTQSEIAGILGVSQVQISRMEKKLLAKMRERFT